MARLKEIVVDAAEPAALARFWAEALDDYAVRAYDDAEIDRLAALGFTPETDPSVAVDGPGPTLFFQLSTEPKTQRNRVHLDLTSTDAAEELKRLRSLGATVRERRSDHTVLLDPEGNEFCLQHREQSA